MTDSASSSRIPLAGSLLEHLERRGAWLAVTLATPGAGRVQLLFFNGEAHGTVAALPLAVAAGTLETSEGSLGSSLPSPFPFPGAVELHLEGSQGERLTIAGQSLTLRAAEPDAGVVSLGRTKRPPA